MRRAAALWCDRAGMSHCIASVVSFGGGACGRLGFRGVAGACIGAGQPQGRRRGRRRAGLGPPPGSHRVGAGVGKAQAWGRRQLAIGSAPARHGVGANYQLGRRHRLLCGPHCARAVGRGGCAYCERSSQTAMLGSRLCTRTLVLASFVPLAFAIRLCGAFGRSPGYTPTHRHASAYV